MCHKQVKHFAEVKNKKKKNKHLFGICTHLTHSAVCLAHHEYFQQNFIIDFDQSRRPEGLNYYCTRTSWSHQ